LGQQGFCRAYAEFDEIELPTGNKTMHKTENIIFDLGGVLYSLDFDTLWDGFRRTCGKTISEIQETLYGDGLLISYECGKISSMEYYEAIVHGLESKMSFTDFKAIWNSLLVRREDMFRIVMKLKGYSNIYVLSNTNEINAEVLDVDLEPVTSNIIYSFQVGCMKPDQAIYETALKKWCISPESSVFIDDTWENCEAAHSAGIATHVFSEVGPFLRFLKEAGIILDTQSLDLVSNRLPPW